MSIKGKTLRSQSQQLVLNLLEYFEKENGGPLVSVSSVQERTANALGISTKTVQHISSRSKQNPVIRSLGKKRPRTESKTTDLSESSKIVIWNTLYDMYSNTWLTKTEIDFNPTWFKIEKQFRNEERYEADG